MSVSGNNVTNVIAIAAAEAVHMRWRSCRRGKHRDRIRRALTAIRRNDRRAANPNGPELGISAIHHCYLRRVARTKDHSGIASQIYRAAHVRERCAYRRMLVTSQHHRSVAWRHS